MTFDRFHVIKLMNERLDDLRRELAREAQDHEAKEAIKGLRWLLLHRHDNLEKDAARRLKRSLALNALCNVLTCLRKSSENSGSKETDAKPGASYANGALRQKPAASGNSKPWR